MSKENGTNASEEPTTDLGPSLEVDETGTIRITFVEEGVAIIDDDGTRKHFWCRMEVPFKPHRWSGKSEFQQNFLIEQQMYRVQVLVQQAVEHRKAELDYVPEQHAF